MTTLHCSEWPTWISFCGRGSHNRLAGLGGRGKAMLESHGLHGNLQSKPKSWLPSSCSSTPAEIKNATCSHATSSKNAHSYSQKHFFTLFPLIPNNSHFPKSVLYCSSSRFPLPCCSQAAPVSASHMLPITVMPPRTAPLFTAASSATIWNPPWFQTQQVNKPMQKCTATWLSAYCLVLPNNRALWVSHKKQPEEPSEFSSCCQGSQC